MSLEALVREAERAERREGGASFHWFGERHQRYRPNQTFKNGRKGSKRACSPANDRVRGVLPASTLRLRSQTS